MQYCSLILYDVPENTEVGIDLKFWKVGKNFKGIKQIPLGIHYVYYRNVTRDFLSGQRVGFVEYFSKPGFVAKRWQPEEEVFIGVPLDDSEIGRLDANKEELFMYLGPYPIEMHREWISLSNFISPSTLDRLLPQCRHIFSCPQFQSESSSSQQRLAARSLQSAQDPEHSKPEDLLPKLQVIQGTQFRFTKIPSKPIYPEGLDPSQITSHCMDQTFTLNTVLNNICPKCILQSENGEKSLYHHDMSVSETELLAELQFTFITFLLNHVLDGWNQWRLIVQLLSNCELAIMEHPQLYINVITVLYHQLINASRSDNGGDDEFTHGGQNSSSTAELVDLFFSEVNSSSAKEMSVEPQFLPTILRRFIENIYLACNNKQALENIPEGIKENFCNLQKELLQRSEGFASSLRRRFKWKLMLLKPNVRYNTTELLTDDVNWDDDEAPVIVEL